MNCVSNYNKRPYEGLTQGSGKKMCQEPPFPFFDYLPEEVTLLIMDQALATSIADFYSLSLCNHKIYGLSQDNFLKNRLIRALTRVKPAALQSYARLVTKTKNWVEVPNRFSLSDDSKKLTYLNFPGNMEARLESFLADALGSRKNEVRILELKAPFDLSNRLESFANVERLILDFEHRQFCDREFSSVTAETLPKNLKVLDVKNAVLGEPHFHLTTFRQLLAKPLDALIFDNCVFPQKAGQNLSEELPHTSIESYSLYEEKKMVRLLPWSDTMNFENALNSTRDYFSFPLEDMEELDLTQAQCKFLPDLRFGVGPIFKAGKMIYRRGDRVDPKDHYAYIEEHNDLPFPDTILRVFYRKRYLNLKKIYLYFHQLIPIGTSKDDLIRELRRFKTVSPNLETFVIVTPTQTIECSADAKSMSEIFDQRTKYYF